MKAMVALSLSDLPRKIDAVGSADRKYGSGRKRMARPARVENLAAVEELGLSQEDAP